MGICYEKHTEDTYKAYFFGVRCYVRRLSRYEWVADTNVNELDDDLTTFATRKAAARACIAKLLKRK